jgi:urease beta subunit
MIIRRGEKIEIAVGTRVEFTVGDEVLSDTITFIGDDLIEGEKFDLTHTRFRVVE